MAQFVPAKYAALLKTGDPNKRAAVPTRFLSAKQKLARGVAQRMKTENATLYDPMAQLSGKSLRDVVNSMTNAELQPQLSALDRESKTVGAQGEEQQRRNAGYYQQIAGMIPSAQKAQTDASTRLAGQVAQSGQNVTDAISASLGGEKGISEQDRLIRGTGLDAGTSQRLAGEFAQQQIAAGAQTQANVDQANARNAGWEGLVNTAAVVLPGQFAQSQTELGNQTLSKQADIAGKRADVEATRGGIAMKNLTDLRASEFEKAATAQTLHIKGTQADTAAATARANITDKTQRRIISRDKQAEINRHDRAMATHQGNTDAAARARQKEQTRHDKVMEDLGQRKLDATGKKGASGVTPFGNKLLAAGGQTKQQSNFGKLDKFIETHKSKGRVKLAQDITSSAELRKAIGISADTPEAVISAALDKQILGYLSRGTIHKLWRSGISVKGLGVSTKKPSTSAAKSIPGLGGTVK